MSPSNSKLFQNRDSTSCIQNINGKRSFLITSENDVTDNDIYHKRKKSTKHSQADINNAVLAASNGYMTRNKLSKQLTYNSELVETSVTENKCPTIDNIKNETDTSVSKSKKKKKPSKNDYKNKLQLGYVFTNDISSPNPGKQSDTEYKKSFPSLFESDSDPETNDFPLKDRIKSEVEEISTYISNPDNICSAFDKNVEMRTYFNKKSYPINNKSSIKSLNTFEEHNQEPSRLSNRVIKVHDSNLCKSISQNNSKTKKSLKVTGPTTSECMQTNTEDDGIIIVTESFIRQLKNEFQTIKTESRGNEIKTQEIFYDENTNNTNDSNMEQHKDNKVVSKVLPSDYEVNQINMCAISTHIDDICDINFKSSTSSELLLKQDMDVINESDKFTPFKTTDIVENSLMSIFDEPKENVLVESYTNINESLIDNSDSNTSEKNMELSTLQIFEFGNSNSDLLIDSHTISEKNITCHLSPDQIEPNLDTNPYFHTVIKDDTKIKSNTFDSKRNFNCLPKNNNLSSSDNYSKKYNNLYSKCYCKNFSSFNNDNKIFTSKIKHFAFNNNAKKIRQNILRKKHIEANLLKMLITKEHTNVTQSREEHKPIFNSISINNKYEKCINLKENDHIEPSILSMLKDVYVDVEYLTEYCDYNTSDNKFPELQNNNKDIKVNIQASKVKPIDNMHLFKNNNTSTSNNTTLNKPIDFELCDEKYDYLYDNEIINNDSTSNIPKIKKPVNFKHYRKNKRVDNASYNTTANEPVNHKHYNESLVNFNKNKIINNNSLSNSTTQKPVNSKPCDESFVNFNKNKIVDNVSVSNSTTTQKTIIFKPCDESYGNFNKNKIIDNGSVSNSTTTQKPVSFKPFDESYGNFNKNKIIDNGSVSNSTTTQKPVSFKPFDESYGNFNKNKIIDNVSVSNSTTTQKPVNFKPCDESYGNFNKNKIIDNVSVSNSTTTQKPVSFKPFDESYGNFNKNKIIDNVSVLNSTTTQKPVNFKPCDESYGNFNKNKIIDNVSMSNSTTTQKTIIFKPCDESYGNFNKNEIVDNVSMSNSTTQKTINIKPCDESYGNFNKNEIVDNVSMSNSTTQKTINFKPCDESYGNFNKNEIVDNVSMSNSTTTQIPVNFNSGDESYGNFNKNKIIDNVSMSNSTTQIPVNFNSCDESYGNFNKNKIDYSTNNSLKKNDSDCHTDSYIVNGEIDTNSKIKVEDKFNYDTSDIKYNLEDEKCPELEIKQFDIGHLSNSTIIINKSNGSEEDFKMAIVKCNDIESENILSSAKIKSNYGSIQTKITYTLKDEHTPVPAIIGLEKESKLFEPPQYKNLFDASDTISSKAYKFSPMLPYISENNEPVNNLFNLPVDDIGFSLNNSSSDDDYDDDDNRLLIEDSEPNVDGNVNTNSTCILKSTNNSRDEIKINCISSAASITNFTTEIKFCEKKLINPKTKQSTELNTIKNEKASNTFLPEKKCDLADNNCEDAYLLKEEKNFIDDCMSIEMCNEFYKLKSLNKNIINKNESLSKNIKNILKEMYVDELFVSTCQHMVDVYSDDDLKKNVLFQMDECRNTPSKKLGCDIINENVEKKMYSEYNQSLPMNAESLWSTEINYGNQETNKPSNPSTKEKNSAFLNKEKYDVKNMYPELRQSISTNKKTIINNRNQQNNHIKPTITTQKSNALQKPKNVKSNMKIRIHLREFILSNKPLNEILESKEFRNLRFFGEEEIASSIGVFIFEHIIDTPIITGLSVYKINYDQLISEEKNKILASTNLNISCPKIMKLTSITLALVKMLRSDTLIDVILNVIRKNVLKKQMNTEHTIDDQLIKQIVYFVDICVRSRLLKTLQIFIFDSMVILPNKYCCIIFISLLLWKNCLPKSINNKEDPVIITAMTYLIAKKKQYSEETVGCDIFQRELINLLSCHFNYTFSTDMPTNFVQHIHKPDFFVSVVMILKCCDPKDLVEFVVNCLFPIVDNYLYTQQNEEYAIQTMESINMAIKPFKITCNPTVATYLKKCKDPINGFKKNGKEHIYNTIFNSYKILQNKFIEYLNDSRPRSQYFEESLMSIILMLGSADYLTSCISLMQWKPKFELSAILSQKIVMFKSIIGQNVWDKLCAIDDIKTLKCLVNSCLINKDVYDTIIQIHDLR